MKGGKPVGKQPVPTKEEVESYLKDRRNWGRWGDKSGAGTINLIHSGETVVGG